MHSARIVSAAASVVLFGCGGAKLEDEYRRALPDKATAGVAFPSPSNASGLAAEGSASGLVGGPADLYTLSYNAARDVNGFGAHVVHLVEAISKTTPAAIDQTHAVWGPLSDAGDPNEYTLAVEKTAPDHYNWAILGKHKSEMTFNPLAGGTFVPDDADYGKGVFAVDFDAIKALNPTERGAGRIAYAFAKKPEGVAVVMEAPNAKYAFGQRASGEGFIVFAIPADIHGHDPSAASKTAKEDLFLKARWNDGGLGRVDVVATHGDIANNVLHVTQCWGPSFVSVYEEARVDGQTQWSDGQVSSCSIPTAEEPAASEVEMPAAM